MRLHGFSALLRLELSDALRSKWVAFTAAVYLVLTAAFLWLGLHESSVLGFTGLSRALLNVTSAIIVVCPLLVLIGTHAAIVKSRSSGFCELFLTQPVKRSTWFCALLVSRMLILVGPLVLVLLACLAAGQLGLADAQLMAVAMRSLSICGSLVFSFVGIGLLISSVAQTTERAMVWALLAFVTSAALHDVLLITILLRTPMPPQLVFFLSALNPSEAARVGILSSVDPELSALGPVGFWLANSLGPQVALLLAVGWPLLLGSALCAVALVNVRRMDLVS